MGWGGKGTGKSMRARLPKLPFSNLSLSFSPKPGNALPDLENSLKDFSLFLIFRCVGCCCKRAHPVLLLDQINKMNPEQNNTLPEELLWQNLFL